MKASKSIIFASLLVVFTSVITGAIPVNTKAHTTRRHGGSYGAFEDYSIRKNASNVVQTAKDKTANDNNRQKQISQPKDLVENNYLGEERKRP